MIFIDAQEYLDLYRMQKRKQLLHLLVNLKDHVFVTKQIVDEVMRNKLVVASDFLRSVSKGLADQARDLRIDIPDQLFGAATTQSLEGKMQSLKTAFEVAKREFGGAIANLLKDISTSTDEVSKALQPIFDKANQHSKDELERARQRRECGNPPGKKNDPLGDQLSWEQLLSNSAPWDAVWIISKDGDYVLKHEDQVYLNPALLRDLTAKNARLRVSCFTELERGLHDFTRNRQLSITLPTSQESEQINKEQEKLPPMDWLPITSGSPIPRASGLVAYQPDSHVPILGSGTVIVFQPPPLPSGEYRSSR